MEAICDKARRWTTSTGRPLVEVDDLRRSVRLIACDITQEEAELVSSILQDILAGWSEAKGA